MHDLINVISEGMHAIKHAANFVDTVINLRASRSVRDILGLTQHNINSNDLWRVNTVCKVLRLIRIS